MMRIRRYPVNRTVGTTELRSGYGTLEVGFTSSFRSVTIPLPSPLFVQDSTQIPITPPPSHHDPPFTMRYSFVFFDIPVRARFLTLGFWYTLCVHTVPPAFLSLTHSLSISLYALPALYFSNSRFSPHAYPERFPRGLYVFNRINCRWLG